MKKRGFTLIEILVASLLLVTGIAMLTSVYLGFLALIARLHYRNTAYNLLRDVVEFAETEYVQAGCQFEYKHNPATDKYESTCLAPGTVCPAGTSDPTCCADPFSLMGDIKAKKYVPKSDPNLVIMTYRAEVDSALPDGTPMPFMWEGVCGGNECSFDVAAYGLDCPAGSPNRTVGVTHPGVHTDNPSVTCNCTMLCGDRHYYRIFARIQWTEEGRTFNEELRVVPLGYNKQPGITVQIKEFTE